MKVLEGEKWSTSMLERLKLPQMIWWQLDIMIMGKKDG